MTRVLRSTRREVTRLRKVDETLAVLMSRVAPSPVYDTPVELEVVTRDPRTGQLSGPLYSFTIAMDAAVTVTSANALSGYINVRMGPMGDVEICVSYCGLSDVTQVIAPTVRPVYGDVIAVPAHFREFHSCGASGANTKLVIYSGADVGEKYALKVGEVNRDQVAGLHAALQGKSDCLVRRKGP
jgi:hypothetical protein